MKKLNRAAMILLVTNSLILVSRAMIGPIYALFVKEIGGSLLDASYAFGIFALVAGIVTLLSGKYTDKIKENELIIVFGYITVAIGFFGYLFVNSFLSLLIIQVIIGFGEAVYAPAFDAIYSKHLDRDKMGEGWGLWEALNYFTAAFGAVGGGILVTFFGFNIIFIIMGTLCLGSALYILFLPRIVL